MSKIGQNQSDVSQKQINLIGFTQNQTDLIKKWSESIENGYGLII